jgi:hypothetical protein
MKTEHMIHNMLILLTAGACFAGKPYEDRIYEPVVIPGAKIFSANGLPVSELFVYAYKNNSWTMIPFQIDERVRLIDPDLTKEGNDRIRHFYVIDNINPEYARPDTLPGFDKDDELVFMLRDAGDQAPSDAWISNPESRLNSRHEIILTDPLTGEKAYVYLFQSNTLSMPAEVANHYGMQFDPETHTVQSLAYSMRISRENGLVQDIAIKAPYGSGLDIFDTQKMRMNGYLDWGRGIQLYFGRNDANSASEIIFVVYPNETYLSYTAHPVVRAIREVRQGLGNNKFGFVYESTEFYLTTKNYPFSGSFVGGTVLDPDSIREALQDPAVEVAIEIDYLRQSWDFSANASGMKFYNPHNSGITVDGVQETVNSAVDVIPGQRLQTWAMITGSQGTLFNFFDFAESRWDNVSLYYYDNLNGGQADQNILIALDSGDGVSYGDNGLRFVNTTYDKPLNLDFSFISYMIDANQNAGMAEQLRQWITTPIEVTRGSITSDVTTGNNPEIKNFTLLQNYPNPFNESTKIAFHLAKPSRVRLTLYDTRGLVTELLNQFCQAGTHSLLFQASENGTPLPSGIYCLRLESSGQFDQRKIVLLK